MMCLMCCEFPSFPVQLFPPSVLATLLVTGDVQMKVVALQFLTVSKHPVLYVPSLISPRATLEMLELALPHRLLINNFHHFYIVEIVC